MILWENELIVGVVRRIVCWSRIDDEKKIIAIDWL